MKKIVVASLVLSLLPMACMAQVPEWRPTVVLKVGYGDGEDELLCAGYRAGGEGEGGGIGGFYVCSDGIFISDAIRHDVKVFALSGEYVKAIPAEWDFPSIRVKRNVGANDMVVSGGVIYVMEKFQGPDQFGVTNSVFTFDFETGEQLERIVIHVPTLGIDLEGRRAGTHDLLIVEGEGDISIFSHLRQISYPLVRGGQSVSKEEQLIGTPGIKFGANRIRANGEAPGYRILDGSGTSLVRKCETGYPRVVSPDGNYLLISTNEAENDSSTYSVICDRDCKRLGSISILAGSRASCFIFGPNELFRFGPDGKLYECFDACDALYIYLWSN